MLASSSRNVVKRQTRTRLARISAVQVCNVQHARYASQVASIYDEPISTPRLRANTWNSFPSTTFHNPSSHQGLLARYNIELSKLATQRKTAEMFKLCAQMKLDKVKPNIVTYHLLLGTCCQLWLDQESWAIFEDMIAMGIEPDSQIFEYLIRAVRSRPMEETWAVWNTALSYGIEPNQSLYEQLISRLTNGRNLEAALQQLAVMSEKGIPPSLNTMDALIHVACTNKQPRIALELAEAFNAASVRRISTQTWMRILVASSEMLFAEGVETAWKKTVTEDGITPDEGCCINVLHTAGRHGIPNLGLAALGALKRMNVVWQEWHFAPVLEAFCNEGNVREAFGLLELMRQSNVPPVMETAYPIFRAISTDVDKVDEAFGVLESLKEEGKKVDVIALTVVIQACVAIGDLQRALGTYRAAADLGVQPSVDTYNTLLSACVAARHRELGNRLLEEMREAKIKPNVRTYERLIVLCLTQSTYEDAFFYLEEMKSGGMLPPQTIYEALIRRLISVGDTRYQLAVEEMQEHGYEMPEALQAFIESGGREPEKPRRVERTRPRSQSVSPQSNEAESREKY